MKQGHVTNLFLNKLLSINHFAVYAKLKGDTSPMSDGTLIFDEVKVISSLL